MILKKQKFLIALIASITAISVVMSGAVMASAATASSSENLSVKAMIETGNSDWGRVIKVSGDCRLKKSNPKQRVKINVAIKKDGANENGKFISPDLPADFAASKTGKNSAHAEYGATYSLHELDEFKGVPRIAVRSIATCYSQKKKNGKWVTIDKKVKKSTPVFLINSQS